MEETTGLSKQQKKSMETKAKIFKAAKRNTKTGGGWKCAACGVPDSGKQRRYYESQSPYGDRDGTGGSDSKRLSGGF